MRKIFSVNKYVKPKLKIRKIYNLNNKYESFIFLKIKNNNLNLSNINFKKKYIKNKITRINYVEFKNNMQLHNENTILFDNLPIYKKNKIEQIFLEKFLFLHQLHQEIFFNSFIAALNYSILLRFIELEYAKNTRLFLGYPQWYNCILTSENIIKQFISDTISAETNLFLMYKKKNISKCDSTYNFLKNPNKKMHVEKKYMENNNFIAHSFFRISDIILLKLLIKHLNY
uniref:Uncharacterized protein n=1 Tax=Lotharella vacuolata TaxID=74820 RepID=A0A0H5BKC7_9EUKA|nr:hypothetical protein [Lotharella vacuolata]